MTTQTVTDDAGVTDFVQALKNTITALGGDNTLYNYTGSPSNISLAGNVYTLHNWPYGFNCPALTSNFTAVSLTDTRTNTRNRKLASLTNETPVVFELCKQMLIRLNLNFPVNQRINFQEVVDATTLALQDLP